MIRTLEMELRNVKNVTNGRIVFEENSAGGSVTGIYGQNGSGKTAVIDALECVQRLMSGGQTGKNSGDFIRYGAPDMSIEILFEISAHDGFFARNVYLQYGVTFIRGGADNRLRVSRESFRMSVVRDRMGREVLVHALDSDPDAKGRKNFTMTPVYLWRSIRSIEDIRSDVDYESNTTFDDSLSYMFSPHHLQRILESAQSARREPSQQSKAYLEDTLAPLSKAVELLGDFARNDMHVSTTSRTSTASYSYIVLPDVSSGSEGRIYDLIEPNPVTEEEYESLNDTVARFNLVLSALIPGLRIALQETGQKIMPDGSARLMATFMSLRGEARIPFRCESEGIVRLTSLLSLLVHAYNDQSACVVVDEIDSGVFEYLLGQLLHVMADRAHGQLVFTAHNLRALETMPNRSIVLTTVDADDRFVPFRGVRETNNGRSRYIADIAGGGAGRILYRMTDEQSIATSLYRAGHPDDDGEDVSDALKSLLSV